MKRFLAILFLVVLCAPMTFLFSSCGEGGSGDVKTLYVYNWGEYISDGSEGSYDTNAEFEKWYEKTYGEKVKVNYSTYASNEDMYAKLSAGAAAYDVVIPSDYMIARMITEGMLRKINKENVPNLEYVNLEMLFGDDDPYYDPTNEYSVPYTWGVLGLIYNTKMVEDEAVVASWGALWSEAYMDNILMINNSKDAFGITFAYLGLPINAESTEQVDKAVVLLKEQKKVIQAYVADEVFDKMIGGEAAMAPYYNGDAVTMIADNPDLAFSIPVEGSNLFTDCLCIPKESQKRELAEMYINFMLEPEVGLANTEAIGYSTPNTKVYELLDEETKSDPTAYPDEESLAHCGYYTYIGPELSLYIDSKWAEVLTADEKYSAMIMPMFLGACVAGIIALNIVRATRRKREE